MHSCLCIHKVISNTGETLSSATLEYQAPVQVIIKITHFYKDKVVVFLTTPVFYFNNYIFVVAPLSPDIKM